MKKLIFIICGLLLICANIYSQAKFSIIGNPCINKQLTFIDESSVVADSWLWDFGNGDTSTTPDSVAYQYPNAGNYTASLTITINGSPVPAHTMQVVIYENPVCSFTTDTIRYSSFTRIFEDNSASDNELNSFIWRFGDGNSVSSENNIAEYKYNSEGAYTVWHAVIDDHGCVDSISQVVTISDIYIVPNVFTPNGDGVNDTFTPTVNGVEVFSIEIFSRWGNLVFKREGSNQIIWDGSMPDGSKVKPGTYFYIITAQDSQKSYDPETGFVTIFYENGE